jgi:cytochrome P450
MIAAKNEAIAEDSTIRLDSLKDDNLIIVLKELYFATTDAVQTGLKWLILLLANNPEIQEKIYNEVNDNIGTRMVAQEDKLSLPYTYAFIMETLRIRPPGPISLDLHVNTCDTELGNY